MKTKIITYADALQEAYVEEMTRDENVVFFGEDVTTSNGASVDPLLVPTFGPDRVFDMPINEALICNAAVGMAMAGLRPITEVVFEDFLALGYDAIINEAAKLRFWSHGELSCPWVMVSRGGVGPGCGCNHSQKAEAWFANVPGIKILCPSTAADAKGMMKSAIRDNDPVIFMITSTVQYTPGEVPDDPDFLVPLGKARIAREGTDVTVVCWQLTYNYTMQLAEEFAAQGISIEVVDPRSMCPLDMPTIIESVKKTGRLVVTHEAPYKFGPGAEIITSVIENAMSSLKSAPVRACTPMTAIPSFSTEFATVVGIDQIRDAINKALGK